MSVEETYLEMKAKLHDILRNAVRAAIIVTLAAWQNMTSIGCHYRE